jgi:hypothetical protein
MNPPALLPRERLVIVTTGDSDYPTEWGPIKTKVVDSPNSTSPVKEPHIVLSANTPSGMPTKGFLFSIHKATRNFGMGADPGGPWIYSGTDGFVPALYTGTDGFTVVIWRLNPTLGRWQEGEPVEGVTYEKQFVCWDLSGAHSLYFQIVAASVATQGKLTYCIAELG